MSSDESNLEIGIFEFMDGEDSVKVTYEYDANAKSSKKSDYAIACSVARYFVDQIWNSLMDEYHKVHNISNEESDTYYAIMEQDDLINLATFANEVTEKNPLMELYLDYSPANSEYMNNKSVFKGNVVKALIKCKVPIKDIRDDQFTRILLANKYEIKMLLYDNHGYFQPIYFN